MTSFSLHPLPIDRGDLATWIRSKTVEFHCGKHHKGYVDKLNLLTRGAPAAGQPLEQIIASSEGALFETAAQVWNHDFYWKSLAPDGPRRPLRELEEVVQRQFGGLPSLRPRSERPVHHRTI